MLRSRIVTALLLIPLVVAAVLWLPTPWFGLLLAIVAVLGAAEFARLTGVTGAAGRSAYLASVALSLAVAFYYRDEAFLGWALTPVAAWWILAGIVLFSGRVSVAPRAGLQPGLLVGSALVLLGCWVALLRLHQSDSGGPELVLFLLVLVWVADSAAYFAGRQWGRRKLAPRVSPGKTVEGLAGALAGALICAGVANEVGLAPDLGLLELVALSLITTLVSVAGDLWESLLKRRHNVKDSGALLPGHGGVLDRIDSLLAAAPVFVVGLTHMGGRA